MKAGVEYEINYFYGRLSEYEKQRYRAIVQTREMIGESLKPSWNYREALMDVLDKRVEGGEEADNPFCYSLEEMVNPLGVEADDLHYLITEALEENGLEGNLYLIPTIGTGLDKKGVDGVFVYESEEGERVMVSIDVTLDLRSKVPDLQKNYASRAEVVLDKNNFFLPEYWMLTREGKMAPDFSVSGFKDDLPALIANLIGKKLEASRKEEGEKRELELRKGLSVDEILERNKRIRRNNLNLASSKRRKKDEEIFLGNLERREAERYFLRRFGEQIREVRELGGYRKK